MNPDQKGKIYKLRMQGNGYKAIAKELLLSVDSIKKYCKCHHLNGPAEVVQMNAKMIQEENPLCLQCRTPIRQKGGRPKKFCSNACRYAWWYENKENSNKQETAIYHFICQNCGKKFSSYGNKKRKFCSHDCYIKYRFFGDDDGIY